MNVQKISFKQFFIAARKLTDWIIDWFFGYDFFLSYAHADGNTYPRTLKAQLKKSGFRVFLDEQEYKAGDNLRSMTRRRVRNSQHLVIIGRSAALSQSEWVPREVDVYEERHQNSSRAPIIINVKGALEEAIEKPRKEAVLAHVINEKKWLWIPENIEHSDSVPSNNTIERIKGSFEGVRQDTKRMRIFQGLVGIFFLITSWAIIQKNIAVEQTRKALHQLAMTYWNNAVDERNKNPLKAAHYFSWAAETFSSIDDRESKATADNAKLALEFLLGTYRLQSVVGFEEKISGAIPTRNLNEILTWTKDSGEARVWDIESGKAYTRTLEHADKINGAKFYDDESRVLTWGGDQVRLWKSKSGEEKKLSTPIKYNAISGATFNAKESSILTWGEHIPSDTPGLWDLKEPIEWVKFNANKQLILTKNKNNLLQVWDVDFGIQLSSIFANEESWGEPFESGDTVVASIFDFNGSEPDWSAQVWGSKTGNPLTRPLIIWQFIQGAQLNVNGSRVLTWNGYRVQIWDSETSTLITPPIEYKDLQGAKFNKNGNWFVTWGKKTVSEFGSAQIWSSETGKLVTKKPIKLSTLITGVEFNTKGNQLLVWGGSKYRESGNPHGEAKVWDIENNLELYGNLKHNESISGALFNKEGSRILSWSWGNTVRIWDISSYNSISMAHTLKHKNEVYGATYDTNEQQILTWSKDMTAQVWGNNGETLTLPLMHESEVHGAQFSPDDRQILTWSNNSARLWESVGKEITPEKYFSGTAFNLDGSRILTWSWNEKKAQLWNNEATVINIQAVLMHESSIKSARFIADESRVLTTDNVGRAKLWKSDTGEQLDLFGPDKDVRMAFNADESRILTWNGSMARVWNSRTGKPLDPQFKHGSTINGAMFSADARRILTWGGGLVRLWNVVNGKELIEKPIKYTEPYSSPEQKSGATINADASQIIIWSTNSVHRWSSSKTPKEIKPLLAPNFYVQGALFNADNSRILIWHLSEAVLWNTKTNKKIKLSLTHEKGMRGAMFSADGTRVLTWGGREARVWDSLTGKAVTPLILNKRGIKSAQFNPTGNRIVTWDNDDTPQLWDSITGNYLTPPLRTGITENGGGFTWNHNIAINTDVSRILFLKKNGRFRVLDSKWPSDKMILKVEVETGTKLDPTGGIKVLEVTAWQEKNGVNTIRFNMSFVVSHRNSG